MSKGKECKCGKAMKKREGQRRVIASCPECKQQLSGSNGRLYPIHVAPVTVTMQQVTEWRNDGHNILIESTPDNG